MSYLVAGIGLEALKTAVIFSSFCSPVTDNFVILINQGGF